MAPLTPSIPAPLLLVIAHPDDECMFFTPSLSLARSLGQHIHVMCLSNGNAESLGRVREKELVASCAVLGVEGRRVQVVDDPGLQDGFQNRWPPELVAGHVARAVERIGRPCEILTFDEGGVSGHPNHVDTCRGVRRYMAGVAEGSNRQGGGGGGAGSAQPGPGVTYRELRTVPVYRKYLGAVGVLLQVTLGAAWGIISSLLQLAGFKGAGAGRGGRVSRVVCRDPTLAARALLRHRSQLVWYRLLYLGLSSYVVANELVTVEPRS